MLTTRSNRDQVLIDELQNWRALRRIHSRENHDGISHPIGCRVCGFIEARISAVALTVHAIGVLELGDGFKTRTDAPCLLCGAPEDAPDQGCDVCRGIGEPT